jgi:hypothetical protein
VNHGKKINTPATQGFRADSNPISAANNTVELDPARQPYDFTGCRFFSGRGDIACPGFNPCQRRIPGFFFWNDGGIRSNRGEAGKQAVV